MESTQLCVNCFKYTGGEDVCMHCGFEQSAAERFTDALRPKTVLNKYVIGRVLKIDQESILYKAYDINLEHVVVINEFYPRKTCIIERMPNGTVDVSREYMDIFYTRMDTFLNTSRIIRNASNENVISFFDEFEANGTAYQVLEYLEGMTLESYFEQVPSLSFEEASTVMIPVMEGLEALHKMGIVFQSLSPKNIMIATSGDVKLFGFDNVKLMKDTYSYPPTAIDGYSAPEVYAQKKASFLSDIYSVGAIWFRILSGVIPPHAGQRKKNIASFHAIGLTELSVPELVEAVIFKAISLKPDHRFTDMRSFIESINGEGWRPKKSKIRPSAILAVAATLLVLLLGSCITIYSILNHSIIPFQDTDLTIWYVDNGDEELNARWTLVEKRFKEFVKSQHKNLDVEINLNIQGIRASNYQAKLKKSFQKREGMPDIYFSADIQNDENAYPLDTLYEAIDKKYPEQSASYTAMKSFFEPYNKIALCYDLPVMYASTRGNSFNDLKPYSNLKTLIGTSDIGSRRFEHPLICNPDAVLFAACAYGYQVAGGKTGSVESLYRCASNKFQQSSSWKAPDFVNQSICYYIGFSSEYRSMIAQKSNLRMTKLRSADSTTGYIYPEVWSINKNADKKRIKAAISLLYYLCSEEKGQAAISYVNRNVCYIPLTTKIWEKNPYKANTLDHDFYSIVNSEYDTIVKNANAYAKIYDQSVKIANLAKDQNGTVKELLQIIK